MNSSIPVKISPFFWITAALIGWLSSFSLTGTLIWIAIIFFSILIHELGHALTARLFGQYSRIELVAFGGVTIPEGPRLSPWKEFIVIFNGPLASFSLYLLGSALLSFPVISSSEGASIIQAFRLINLFWTVINLLPVLPLDGGQLLRVTLEGFFGVKGLKASMLIGIILSFGFASVAFFLGWFLAGAIFFMFGFQNIQTYRLARPICEVDKTEAYHIQLIKAEEAILSSRFDDAEKLLGDLREKTKQGVLFISATQHLATLVYNRKDFQKTFELLKSIEEDLSDDFMQLMHQVAFECKDYGRVYHLAKECYQKNPSVFVAIRSAVAAAYEQKVQESIGWLEAAIRDGAFDLEELLKDPGFDKIRSSDEFKNFLEKHTR